MKYNEKVLKSIFVIVIALLCSIAYAAIYMGMNINKIFYWGFAISAIFGVIAMQIYKKLSQIKIMKRVREDWGKSVNRKRNFLSISELFNFNKCNDNLLFIDDETWQDLNMDDIYKELDRTVTNMGEQMLYNILRNPVIDGDVLKKRKKMIGILGDDKQIRERIQWEFVSIGKQINSSLFYLLWEDIDEGTAYRFIFYLIPVITIASLAAIAFIGPQMIFMAFAGFAASLFIHNKTKDKLGSKLDAITYLDRVMRAAYHIGNFEDSCIGEYTSKLKILSDNCKKLLKNTGALTIDYVDELSEYINIIFLMNERKYYKVNDQIKLHREELKEIYMLLGELDALISVASYRSGLSNYVEPEFKDGGAEYDAKNLRHPLLKDPVPNSITIKGSGVIITGSNMSGKSTFLRTIGVNALFAQTICTCLAASYCASYFKIITSISQTDNILGGKSYYLAEAEGLLRIVKGSGDKIPLLCIIDEIFRGTNSIERIAASVEILDYLVKNNTIPIAATHDLEITELIGNKYECYYFSENVGEKGLDFDYHIKNGTSIKRNAVKLMNYLGYPKEIIVKINNRVSGTNEENTQ